MKRSRLEGRSEILIWKWTLEPLDHSWNDVETKGHQQQLHQTLRHNLAVMNPRCVDKERTQKHSGSELSGLKSAELLDAGHARLPVRGSHTLVNAEPSKESRRTAAAEETKREVAADPDTRPLDQSSSSTDPEPKRPKTTTVADTENSADQMDEDRIQDTRNLSSAGT